MRIREATVRPGQHPVLLDYPYIYKLDGNKLYCSKQDPDTGFVCDGEIDYDAGFNHLVCTRCGKIYLASDLRDNSIDNRIIIKGGTTMKVSVCKGNQTLYSTVPSEDVITKRKIHNERNTRVKSSYDFNVEICGGKTIYLTNQNNHRRDDSRLFNKAPVQFNVEIAATRQPAEKQIIGKIQDQPAPIKKEELIEVDVIDLEENSVTPEDKADETPIAENKEEENSQPIESISITIEGENESSDTDYDAPPDDEPEEDDDEDDSESEEDDDPEEEHDKYEDYADDNAINYSKIRKGSHRAGSGPHMGSSFIPMKGDR